MAYSEMEGKREPRDGWFVRDLETDTVTCPAGHTMHRKCVKSNGCTRYIAKAACRRCEYLSQCYRGKGKWKEVDFSGDAVYVHCLNLTKAVEDLRKPSERAEGCRR